jgi:hypothetical protein
MTSGLPEIPRSRLEFSRFRIEDSATGDFYAIVRGSVTDAKLSPATAFFIDADDEIVWLEHPGGPRNRKEFEARQAERARQREERMRPRSRR